MLSTIDQAFQALYLCKILPINFSEALFIVTTTDRAVARTLLFR